MLEMLVCLIIIASLSLVGLNSNNNLNFEHYSFLNEYLLKQSKAIAYKQDMQVGNGIYLNSMGHVNQAKTLTFNSHKVIIHLGNGYATKQ